MRDVEELGQEHETAGFEERNGMSLRVGRECETA
jgi:hypothetical protein